MAASETAADRSLKSTLPERKAIGTSGDGWHGRPGDLDPVLAAEVDVEDDERDLLLRLRDAGDVGEPRRLEHAVALQLEVHPAEEAYRLVVVGDDDQPLGPAVHRGRVYPRMMAADGADGS